MKLRNPSVWLGKTVNRAEKANDLLPFQVQYTPQWEMDCDLTPLRPRSSSSCRSLSSSPPEWRNRRCKGAAASSTTLTWDMEGRHQTGQSLTSYIMNELKTPWRQFSTGCPHCTQASWYLDWWFRFKKACWWSSLSVLDHHIQALKWWSWTSWWTSLQKLGQLLVSLLQLR